MSKIQEALKRLQNGEKSEDATPKKVLRNQVRIESARSIAKPRKGGSAELGAQQHIDVDSLVEKGILPEEEHLQLIADEFRRIKRPLIKNAFGDGQQAEDHANVLMVTSAFPQTGKTFCALNLALSIAMERELNVLLVDADVAKPQISRAFGLDDAKGLIDLLIEDSGDVRSAVVPTDLHDIYVLSAGRAHPQATELLASTRMSEVVHDLATEFPDRLVIIDSPPLLMTSEAQALANQVGQIVVIVEYGKTNHETLHDTLELLDRNKPINAIFNKSVHWSHGGYYGANYGYYDEEKNIRE